MLASFHSFDIPFAGNTNAIWFPIKYRANTSSQVSVKLADEEHKSKSTFAITAQCKLLWYALSSRSFGQRGIGKVKPRPKGEMAERLELTKIHHDLQEIGKGLCIPVCTCRCTWQTPVLSSSANSLIETRKEAISD
jgi:hypothetical protein